MARYRYCNVVLFCGFLAVVLVNAEGKSKGGFYAFKVRDINNEVKSLEEYRGKISLVVNVASECGYTDEHYKQMSAIYDDLAIDKKEPFTILAFPCNQFGNQEPHDNLAIQKFAKSHYGVNFPILGKTIVTGHEIDPSFSFLARHSGGNEPTWNFWKYLVDENGAVIGSWGPRVTVMDIKSKILEAIKQLKVKSHNEL